MVPPVSSAAEGAIPPHPTPRSSEVSPAPEVETFSFIDVEAVDDADLEAAVSAWDGFL